MMSFFYKVFATSEPSGYETHFAFTGALIQPDNYTFLDGFN